MTQSAPHVSAAIAYADGVKAGSILACKWARLACARFQRDLERAGTSAFPYRFDMAKAERVCRFIELLPHVKGKWARSDPRTRKAQTIKLEPWQCFIICNIFGWVRRDNGKRRFRQASVYVPRKNAKSTLAAAIGWWMFAKDDEPGAEVYSGATTEHQAWEVFGPALQMAKAIPALPKGLGITVNAGSLVRESDAARFLPVIGKPGDGASPHCAIVDEYHEHPTSELHDTMLTGMGAREQPLLLIISTAGSDLKGPCREDWKESERILEGTVVDETHFCIIYTIDDGDDWTTDAALRKANPNFDISVDGDFLRTQLAKAIRDPRSQGTFKTKHLNQWVTAKYGYFNVQRWHELANPKLKRDDFAGQPCILAGDFGNKSDLTCMIELYPEPEGRFAVFCNTYVPRATVEEPQHQHYRAWERGKWLTVTEGSVMDPDRIYDDAELISTLHGVIEMPIDPNRAWGMMPEFQRRGLPVIEYRLVMLMMSEPMKFLDGLIKAGRIRHDGNPILAWALGNVTAKEDVKGGVYPNREGAENKIDPAVALIMAVGRALLHSQGAAGGFAFA